MSVKSVAEEPATKRRLLSLDLARGGMLLLIAMAYAVVYVESGFGVDASEKTVLDRVAAFTATLFLDNRAFPLFAILFGYGLARGVDKRSARGGDPGRIRGTLRRRAWLLMLLGAFHGLLVFPGEILTSYALALLLTGWLLFRSNRALDLALFFVGLFYVVVVPLFMVQTALTEDGFGQAVPGYSATSDWLERLVSVPSTPLYTALVYPLLFTVLLGYRAGRVRLFEQAESRRPLLQRIALGGLAVSVIGALPAGLSAIGAVDAGSATGLLLGLQVLTGVAGGAGYAACFALGAERLQLALPKITRALAAAGKRSLTFYIFNSIVLAVVLHPEVLGVGSWVGTLGALVVAAVVWSTAVVLASWLERTGQPGPLEQLMRRGITGREKPDMIVAPSSETRIRPPRLRIVRRSVAWWMLRVLSRWGLLLLALVVAYGVWDFARVWLIAPIVAAGLIFLVRLLVEPWWRYRVHRWEITEHAVYASNGWLIREWRVAPMTRIQTVDAVRGPLEQLLGLSTLRVTTASSHGSVEVNGLDWRTAEEAAARLATAAELTEGDAT